MYPSRNDAPIILIRGGGDLASGAALRLHRAGLRVLVAELPAPLVVRRLASFAEAVFDGAYRVEEVEGVLTSTAAEALTAMNAGKVAVAVDPELALGADLHPFALVDARMLKVQTDSSLPSAAPFVIGLGPGFTVGVNCYAIVETVRGPFVGRVYWQGGAEQDTGIPESVKGFAVERVLYAPADGVLEAKAAIGDLLEPGMLIAIVGGGHVTAKFKGVLRGLIHEGLEVRKGMKIGDLDPRCDARLCTLASDKALAVGGGVLEAVMMMLNKGAK